MHVHSLPHLTEQSQAPPEWQTLPESILLKNDLNRHFPKEDTQTSGPTDLFV